MFFNHLERFNGEKRKGSLGMRGVVMCRVRRIHDLIFVQVEHQSLGNCTALGITTVLVHPAKPEWELHSRRRGAEEFSVTIPSI